MITLYDHIESPCCQKVRLLLAEKKLPFHAVWVDIERGDNLQPSYLALNPKAEVPVLVHEVDGEKTVITQSTIICEYIEDCFPQRPLFPAQPAERAIARNWALLVDMGIHVPHTAAITFTIAMREPLLAMLDTAEKKAAYLAAIKDPVNREVRVKMLDDGFESVFFLRALKAYDELFQSMDAQLEKTQWLAGDGFSYADVVIAPYVKRCLILNLDEWITRYRKIMPWYESLIQRDSWQTEIAGKDAEFVARFKAASEGSWSRVEPLLPTSP